VASTGRSTIGWTRSTPAIRRTDCPRVHKKGAGSF
jgi:hypothetical protein